MKVMTVAVAGIGTALAIGLISAAGQSLAGGLQNAPVPFGTTALVGFLAALSWVPIGACVVWASVFFPVRPESWQRTLPIHIILAGLVSAPINVIILSLWAAAGLPLPPGNFWTAVGTATLTHVPPNAMMYACIGALTHLRVALRPPDVTPAEPAAARRPDHVTVRSHGRVVRIGVQAIDWIEGADDYACIHADGRTHLFNGRLRDLEQALDPQLFLRVHRSALINLKRVIEVSPATSGSSVARLHNGATVKVSRSRKAELLRALAAPGAVHGHI